MDSLATKAGHRPHRCPADPCRVGGLRSTFGSWLRSLVLGSLVVLAIAPGTPLAWAQGGVKLDLATVLAGAPSRPASKPAQISTYTCLSLRRVLEQAAQANGGTVPPDLALLDGLIMPEYLVVTADDWLLVGPAADLPSAAAARAGDGQMIRPLDAAGRPFVRFASLVDLWRTLVIAVPRPETIGCSLDVEAEAWSRMRPIMAQASLPRGGSPMSLAQALADAMGPQQVRLFGLNPSSDVARTFVEADYVMKCLAIGQIRPTVAGWKSHLDLKSVRDTGHFPRWWFVLAPGLTVAEQTYHRGSPGLTLQVGHAIESATPTEVPAGAQKFVDQFNRHWDRLCGEYPPLADLRNLASLAVLLSAPGAAPSWAGPMPPATAVPTPTTADTVFQARAAGRQVLFSIGGVVLTPGGLPTTASTSPALPAWPTIPPGSWRVRLAPPSFRER